MITGLYYHQHRVGGGLILDGKLTGVGGRRRKRPHDRFARRSPLHCATAVWRPVLRYAIPGSWKLVAGGGGQRSWLRRETPERLALLWLRLLPRETPGQFPSCGRPLPGNRANLVNLLNPSHVVWAGVMAAGELIWEGVRREVRARSLAAARLGLRLVPAELGGRAGAMGAVALALQAVNPQE